MDTNSSAWSAKLSFYFSGGHSDYCPMLPLQNTAPERGLATKQNVSSPNRINHSGTFSWRVISKATPNMCLCWNDQFIQGQKFLQNRVRTPLHLFHRAKKNGLSRIQKHHPVRQFFRQ